MMGRRNDVPSLLCASDFFLLPSLHENLSNALLEACHAGCPPIATEVGGNPEVVEHGVSGLLIAPNDSSSLEQAIGTMISRPDLRKAMGKSARMRIEREFSLDLTARRLAEVYGSLLGT